MKQIPLLEFDEDRRALIEPSINKNIGLPDCCVIPYYRVVMEELKQNHAMKKIHEYNSILIPTEVYELSHKGKSITVVCPTACGSPVAGALLESLIASGCRKFVACGSAGALKSDLHEGFVVVPTGAVRDEGTSYHYLFPSRRVDANSDVVEKLEQVVKRHHVNYELGLTWTTDAPFRETRGKIARRKKEGCLTVEMESAAFMAVAEFRGVKFGQYLLAGDDVSGDEWLGRHWGAHSPAHEKMFWLSVEACLDL